MWKVGRALVNKLRPILLFFVLGAALVLTAVLAYQAQDAARSQRRTAESVLEGYALLAGREFMRRVDSQIGYYGVVAAMQPLNRAEVPDPDSLEENQRGRDLVEAYFRWPSKSASPIWKSRAGEGAFAPGTLESLRRRARDFDPDWPYALFCGAGKDGPLVFYRLGEDSTKSWIEGLEANPDALRVRFQKVLDGSPLLPLAINGKAVDNTVFVLSVLCDQGRILFQPREFDARSVQVRENFKQGLGSLRLVLGIDPDTSSQLIIGGLPRSRMPLLLGLLALTSGLILTALFQLRREREFAKRQADFIAAVSHELRTPLAQIQMFVDTLLLERVRNPEEGRRSLEILSQETRRLSHFVENVIQFSRSLRQSARLEIKPIDPVPVIDQLLEHFRPLAESSNCSLRLVSPAVPLRIEADPEALRQILLNLLDNAVKYGPPGQEVVVSLEPQADRAIRIGVEDEGDGVPESQRKKIWQRFERLQQHRNSPVAGTGIGLAVVRELVEVQGGEVWVEAGLHGGARFVLEFPAAASTPPQKD